MKNTFALCISMFICSCSGYQYVPNPHYVPLHKEKGEIICNGGLGKIQLGYSLLNHLAVFAAGKYRYSTNKFDNLGVRDSDYDMPDSMDIAMDANIGVGFFKHLGKFVFETYASPGFGKLDYTHTYKNSYDTSYFFNLNSKRFNVYIQQNFGILINKCFEVAISAKFTKFVYYDINNQIYGQEINRNISSDTYFLGKKTVSMAFFEPGLTFRGGFQNFKIQWQIVKAYNLIKSPVNFRDLSSFISFNMNLNVLKSSKRKN
jgi:hypothetical protein